METRCPFCKQMYNVDDEALGLVRVLSTFAAHYRTEARGHAEQQQTPVHPYAPQKAVVAVLPRLKQTVEALAP